MQFFKLLWTFFVMAIKKTHEQFLAELREKNKHFREGDFTVVGMYECFSKINEETLNFKLNKNIEDVKKTSRIN